MSEALKRESNQLERQGTGNDVHQDGKGVTTPLDELRPHRALAAPVREAGNGGRARPQQLVALQPEINPKWTLCRSQSMGKVRISRASDRPDGSSPLRIASMISGASVVSFRMRTI